MIIVIKSFAMIIFCKYQAYKKFEFIKKKLLSLKKYAKYKKSK